MGLSPAVAPVWFFWLVLLFIQGVHHFVFGYKIVNSEHSSLLLLQRDYVYIYDGLPDDMLVDAPSFMTKGRSLGSFCGQAQMEAPTVVATSGK